MAEGTDNTDVTNSVKDAYKKTDNSTDNNTDKTFGGGTSKASNWQAKVDWAKVAADLKPVDDYIAGKIQDGKDRRKMAAETGMERSDIRKMQRAERKDAKGKGDKADKIRGKVDKADQEEYDAYSRGDKVAETKTTENNSAKEGKEEYTVPSPAEQAGIEGDEINVGDNKKKDENEDEDGSPAEYNVNRFFPLSSKKNKSPMKFGGGNANLINAYRRTSQQMSQGPNWSKVREDIERGQAAYEEKIKEAAQTELEQYNVNAADNGFKEFGDGQAAAMRYFDDKKKQLAQLKQDAAKNKYRGKKYRDLKDQMQKIEDETDALNGGMKAIQDQKLQWVKNNGYGPDGNGIDSYSAGSDPKDKHLLDQIYSKNARMFIDTDNSDAIMFEVTYEGEKDVVSLNELTQKVYKKDTKSRVALSDYRNTLKKNVKENLDFDGDRTMADINYMLSGANTGKIMSWMWDDIDGTGTSFEQNFLDAFGDTIPEEMKEDLFNANSALWKQADEEGVTFGEHMKREIAEYYTEGLRNSYNTFQSAKPERGNQSLQEHELDGIIDFEEFVENNE